MPQMQKKVEEEEEDWNGLEWWLLRGKLVSLTDVQSSFLFAVAVGNYNTWETSLFVWHEAVVSIRRRDGNANVKRPNSFRLAGKTTTLQMHHTFLYIS